MECSHFKGSDFRLIKTKGNGYMLPVWSYRFFNFTFSFVLGVVTEVVLACHLQNIRNLISLQHRGLVMEDIKSQLLFKHNVIIMVKKFILNNV